MKALVIDSASPEHARLRRLLEEAGQGGVAQGTAGILELLAQRVAGDLVLVQVDPCRAQRRRLCIRVRGGLRQVPVSEVRYFLAEHKYVWVRTAQARWLITDSLQSLTGEFAGRFVRIHRNALVATRYLTGLAAAGRGRYRVCLDGIDETLMVSRRQLARIRRFVMSGQGNAGDIMAGARSRCSGPGCPDHVS